jgi:hypothetical protein
VGEYAGRQVKIFVLFDDEAAAARAVTGLDKRWFAGKAVQVGDSDPAK